MQPSGRPILERVPLTGPASFAIREFVVPAFRYPLHQHPEIELTWIVKGSGLRYVGDSVEPFHSGDMCLLGANLPHTWLSAGDGVKPAHSRVVQFDPARWGRELVRLPEFARIANLFDRAARGLHFGSDVAARPRRKMLKASSPVRQFSALLEVLDELASDSNARPLALAPRSAHGRPDSDPRLAAVLTYLSEHGRGAVSQADAARLVRLSPAAFSRFFRRAVGKTFQSYLTDLRLSEACRQLLETGRTISEIAFDVGFGNLSNFNRSFRIVRGMAPGEFRRQALAPATDRSGKIGKSTDD